MKLRSSTLLVLIAVLVSNNARAQDSPTASPELSRSAFGVRGGVDREFLSSSFYGVPNCPQCSPLITSGTGLANGIGAFYAYHLNSKFSLSLGAGYDFVTGTMSNDEVTSINIDGIATPATIAHTIDVTTNRIALAPAIGYYVLPRLSVNLGSEIGYLLNPTFGSREQLVQPTGRGVFDNGSRTRDEYGGALPNTSNIQAALTLGASYALPMNPQGTLMLVPSVEGKIGLTNLIAGVDWKENGVGASLAMEYRPAIIPPPPPAPIPVPVKPAPPKPPALIASITAAGVDSSGAEENHVTLRIEEFYEIAYVPLVPYVFFDSASFEMPARYDRLSSNGVTNFSEAKLPGNDRLAFYREILNTIGARLRAHPSAHVTLTACADPSMSAKDASSLAEHRGQTVRDYFTSVWGIAPNRISIRTRTLPEHPSPVTDSDGVAEDRRVEITSNDPAILASVFTSDTLRTATPPTIRFHPTVTSDRGIADWTLTATQKGTLLKSFDGTGTPPKSVDWAVSNDPASMPKAPGVLDYRLHVEDSAGQSEAAGSSIPVEQVTLRNKRREVQQTTNGLAEIEKYTLLLFDFNSSDLTSDASGQNARTLAIIKSRITDHSQVSIRGFGDRIGDAEHNRKLADDRARQAASALGLPESDIIPADGNTYPYPNDLPEGRFYSRTVEITIRTPLQSGD